ncbi:hypothetical protein BB560_004322, partial [Smittium megazygosporum]
ITSKYADSAIQVQKLFEENKLLKSQISDLKDKSLKSSGHFSDEEIRFDKKQNYKELVEISKRYTHLLKEYEGLSKAHEGASKALKRAVADVDKWQFERIQQQLKTSNYVSPDVSSYSISQAESFLSDTSLKTRLAKHRYFRSESDSDLKIQKNHSSDIENGNY